MTRLDAACGALARIAPLSLAEDWDNVGLLIGDRRRSVARVMTCLTISAPVIQEAIQEAADLIVTHHPLPFKPLSKITSDSITGSYLLELIEHRIAVYSAHTAFDSAQGGINEMLGQLLELRNLKPLVERQGSPPQTEVNTDASSVTPNGTVAISSAANNSATNGSGRFGQLPSVETARVVIRRAAESLGSTSPRMVGDPDREVSRVALACGSGGSFLAAAARRGCDLLITGEATFHACLEAEALGISLGLLGHYWSERFGMDRLAETLGQEFPDLAVWSSRRERDPVSLA
jgi:dinuclear metal center YbgI/SA1388 family protein